MKPNIIYIFTSMSPYWKSYIFFLTHPTLWRSHKIFLDSGKRTDFWHLVLLGEKVLFEESPPSIMVTRNPNWSTEIL